MLRPFARFAAALCAALVLPAAGAAERTTSAAAPTLVVQPPAVRPGATVTLSGSGWRPGAPVSLSVGPLRAGADPVATVRAGSSGSFRRAVQLGAKAKPGTYAFVACQSACRVKTVTQFRILAGGVESGRVTFGRGAAGIALGMTRAQVVARLGTPLYANANGYLQLGKKNLFDLYLDRKGRVQLVGLIGPGFCTSSGICVGDRMREVLGRYGGRVHTHVAPDEHSYVLEGMLGGKRTFTTFLVENGRFSAGSKIVQLFIGYCAGTSYCG